MTEKATLKYVLDKTPALKVLIEKYGNISLYKYGEMFYGNTENFTRKDDFLKIIQAYTSEKHGLEVGKKVATSLKNNYVVSTSDHHGPMGHPFFFQSSILRGLVHPSDSIINLCTSHVSLGNSSYPRGFVLQSDIQNRPLHLPFFSASKRMCPVFGYPAFTERGIENHCIAQLSQHVSLGHISTEKSATIHAWLQKNLLSSYILGCSNYSEQITLINKQLWGDIFRKNMPDFIPLDAEDIVIYILIDHIKNTGFWGKILFGNTMHTAIEKNFDGISCCFDLKNRRGTYLFWYLDKYNKRHALWREGTTLISDSCDVKIILDQENILNALQKKNIIPSGLLVYSILAGYYGLRCFGGYAQGTYLPHVLNAYTKTTGESVPKHESILCEDMIFSFTQNGRIATALDMLYEKECHSPEKLLINAQNTTLETSICSMIPEIIRCLSI